MKKVDNLEKLKTAIRFFFLLTILVLLGSGIFLDDSNIYAQEQSSILVPQEVKEVLYDRVQLSKRGFAPKSVTVRTMDDVFTVLVYSDNAKDILKEADIHLDSDDEILPSSNEYIPHLGTIVIVKVDSFTHTEVVSIQYEKVEVKDDTMDKGTKVVDAKGSNGLQENTIRTIFKDNKEYRKDITDTKIIVNAINEVTRVGTKPVTVAGCDYWGTAVNELISDERERRWMKSIMYWESGCDSGRGMDKYFEGSKAAYGLFQFQMWTFKRWEGTNIWDGYDQIETAHKMYNYYHDDESLSRQWPTNKLFLKYYGDKYGPKD